MEKILPFAPYILICMTTLACWFTSRKPFLIGLCGLAVGSGVLLGRIDLIGALFIALCGLFAFELSRSTRISLRSVTSFCGFTFVSLGLMAHSLPGFQNFLFFEAVRFSDQAVPFSMYLNLDKPFIGLFLLIFLDVSRSHHFQEVFASVKRVLILLLLLLSVLIPVAISINYIAFDPKFPDDGIVWMINNLLIVCVAEEVFFRGFLQNKISRALGDTKFKGAISVGCAAILFGLAHYKGGVPYIALSTFAGIFYGYALYSTRRIEAAILLHFLTNLTHFLFFTYPALDPLR